MVLSIGKTLPGCNRAESSGKGSGGLLRTIKQQEGGEAWKNEIEVRAENRKFNATKEV
jgi:hypothetical protein